MGCLLGKQDINDIHPDIFSVHNIDHEVCLLFFVHSKGGLTSEGILSEKLGTVISHIFLRIGPNINYLPKLSSILIITKDSDSVNSLY